jgi:hypothetical protein
MPPFSVVVGYMPNVDRLPRAAKRLGLDHRVAFVMRTDSPYSDGAVFNAPLYHALVVMVWDVLQSDRAEVDWEIGVSSLAELETLMTEHSGLEDMPLPRLVMFRGPTAVGLLESEPWVHVGGPQPYDDSYNIAVFTSSDVSDLLVARAHEVAQRCESDLGDVIRMSPQAVIPTRLDWLRAAVWPRRMR